jgi:ankyrin repeat protein
MMRTLIQNELEFIEAIERGEHASIKSYSGNALHLAAIDGYSEACNQLIDLGYNVNEPNKDGHSVFSMAAKRGKYDTCKLLIARGAILEAKNQGAKTELSEVLHFNPGYSEIGECSKIATLLIESGCDVNKSNPLRLAAKEGLLDVCDLLIKRGANVDAGYGLPLRVASSSSNIDICELLISHGALVNHNDWVGNTPLHCANAIEVYELLIKHNAAVSAKDDKGQTPLHIAARSERLEACKLLLKNNAEINAKDNVGNTPMHLTESSEVIELLIGAGADVNVKNGMGDTILHKIVEEACTDDWHLFDSGTRNEDLRLRKCRELDLATSIELLIKNGAEITENNLGKSPLQQAMSSDIVDPDKVVKIKHMIENALLMHASAEASKSEQIPTGILIKPNQRQRL